MRLVCFLLCLPLFAQFERIAEQSGGTVGVAAVHVESGRTFRLRANEPFPMASVFKLPVALTVLSGKTPLSLKIKLDASSIRPFRSPIAPLVARGATFTYLELLDAMLIGSDNTAADFLLRTCGGGAAVTAYLRKLGIEGIRVDRSEGEMALDYAGVTNVPPPSQWTLDWFTQAMNAVPKDRQREAAQRFLTDERDTATPDAMLKLLERKEINQVLDRMRRTVPGSARIKAGLPAGAVVAHRPGTGGDNEGVNLCTNDVGLVDLPNGTHLILAIFVKGSNKDLASRERTIADITRAIYDSLSK